MVDINIRLARRADAEQVSDIYKYYVENTTNTFQWDSTSEEDFVEKIDKTLQHYPFLVAEANNEIVGYTYTSQYRPQKAFDWTTEISIYTKVDSQYKGVGTKLYQFLEVILKAQNFHVIVACITVPNAASESFHQKHGFQRKGLQEEVGYKFGEWQDVIWYEKKLSNLKQATEIIPLPQLNFIEELV